LPRVFVEALLVSAKLKELALGSGATLERIASAASDQGLAVSSQHVLVTPDGSAAQTTLVVNERQPVLMALTNGLTMVVQGEWVRSRSDLEAIYARKRTLAQDP
jgi:hypothetical protein